VISDGAKESSLRAGSFDDGINQRSRGGFAVGAGDGGELSAHSRDWPKKFRGSDCKSFARGGNLNPRDARRRAAGAVASLTTAQRREKRRREQILRRPLLRLATQKKRLH